MYQKEILKKKALYYDSAMACYDAGISVRPQMAVFYNNKGILLERKGDKKEAAEVMESVINMLTPTYDFIVEKGLTLNATVSQIESKLGKPSKSNKPDSLSNGDSQRRDDYSINSKDVYTFYYKRKDEKEYKLMGIKYDPPKEWPDYDRKEIEQFDIDPYVYLANYHHDQKDYDKTLVYLNKVQKLQPDDPEVNRFITQVFMESGKSDVAIKTIEENMKKYPDNKTYYLQYADYLAKENKFTEAITYYDKALAIDPEFDVALYNIGSAYKNKASIVEKEEKEIAEKNPDYARKFQRYFPDLEKSAAYFEKTLNTVKFKDDLSALSELANIYQVTEKNDLLKSTVEKLESLEYVIPVEKKEQYLYLLLRIYSSIKDDAKTTEIEQKIKELGK